MSLIASSAMDCKKTAHDVGEKTIAVYTKFEGLLSFLRTQDRCKLITALGDASERYRLWAGNIGAFHPANDTRSLDHRLRNAPLVGGRIRELLSELTEQLNTADPEHNVDAGSKELSASAGELDSDDEDLLRELGGITTSQDAKDAWLASGVRDSITRLFKMSATLARSTVSDRFAKAEASQGIRLDPVYDIAHVQEKFKGCKAEQWLLVRLGEAITKRRQYLRYCQSHREKLAQPPPLQSPENASARGAVAPHKDSLPQGSQIAKTEWTRPSAMHTTASTLGRVDLHAVDDGFDDTRSYSTMATSFQNSEAHTLRIPLLPDVGAVSEYFECPYCRTMQKFNGQLSWRKHVFSDIRPYLCMFEDCGMLMFDSKRAWMEHELQRHRRIWFCPMCKQDGFTSEETLALHRASVHDDVTSSSSSQTDSLSNWRPAEMMLADDCLLCDWDSHLRAHNPHLAPTSQISVPIRKYMNHLARHQEQLALFALPKGLEIDSDVDSAVAAQQDSAPYNLSTDSDSSRSHLDEDISGGHPPANEHTRSSTNQESGLWSIDPGLALFDTDSNVDNELKTASWLTTTLPSENRHSMDDTDSIARSRRLARHTKAAGDSPGDTLPAIGVLRSTVNEIPSIRETLEPRFLDDIVPENHEMGYCPIVSCGRYVLDLRAHMTAHENISERPWKCPVVVCEYHTQGFARERYMNAHVWTHFSSPMICGFCSKGSGSNERSFTEGEAFKTHLAAFHGVERNAAMSRRKRRQTPMSENVTAVACSMCHLRFFHPQDLYNHLDACVLLIVMQLQLKETTTDDSFSPESVRPYDTEVASSNDRPTSRSSIRGNEDEMRIKNNETPQAQKQVEADQRGQREEAKEIMDIRVHRTQMAPSEDRPPVTAEMPSTRGLQPRENATDSNLSYTFVDESGNRRRQREMRQRIMHDFIDRQRLEAAKHSFLSGDQTTHFGPGTDNVVPPSHSHFPPKSSSSEQDQIADERAWTNLNRGRHEKQLVPTQPKPRDSWLDAERWRKLNDDGSWSCAYPGCQSRFKFNRESDIRKHWERHTRTSMAKQTAAQELR